MKDYVDLVLLMGCGIYQAPFGSDLKTGDTVIVATGASNEQIGKVADCISVSTDSEEYRFILAIRGIKELRRVKSCAKDFDYSDEDYIKGIE